MCPLGCKITVTTRGNVILDISGNACRTGEGYARQEILSPSRIIMSVVRCRRCDMPTVSVKTEKPVPKDRMEDIMRSLRDIEVEAPVNAGDVIVENVLGLGINIIATRSVRKKK